LAAALILLSFWSSFPVFSEEGASDVISTRRESELRKEPYPDAESFGILPSKSLVTLTGEEKGNFVEVEVELEDGIVTGWLDSTAIRKKIVKEEVSEEEESSSEKKVLKVRKAKRKKKKRIPVPEDEGLLLKRDPTFSYGALLGAHLTMMPIEDPPGDARGNGFSFGASLSFLLDPSFRLRTELVYSTQSGLDESERYLSVGLFDIAALGEIPLGGDFFVFGGFQYSLAMSLDNEDGAVKQELLMESSDISGIWGQLGAGYRFSIGPQTFMALRARYAGAFKASPVGFHTFGLQAIFELEG